jgi:F-type H+-transporting ATPase subunit delta
MARALLDVAEEKGDPSEIQTGLRQVVAALQEHAELRAALAHPALTVERRRTLAAAAFASAPELLRRFLEIVVASEAISLLPQVEQSYSALWNAKRGVVSAEAVTAAPLDAALRRELEQAIRKATGLTAELRERTDPAVLGGVLLKMSGRTYDGTVRGRLQALRRTLRGETRS